MSTSCTSSWNRIFLRLSKPGSVQQPQTKNHLQNKLGQTEQGCPIPSFLFPHHPRHLYIFFQSEGERALFKSLCTTYPSPGDTVNKSEFCCVYVKSFINQLLKSVFFAPLGRQEVSLWDLFICVIIHTHHGHFHSSQGLFFDLTHDQNHFTGRETPMLAQGAKNLSHTSKTDLKPFNVAHIWPDSWIKLQWAADLYSLWINMLIF